MFSFLIFEVPNPKITVQEIVGGDRVNLAVILQANFVFGTSLALLQ